MVKMDEFRIWRILHYIKVWQEREPTKISLRKYMKICNTLGMQHYEIGKPTLNECVSRRYLELIEIEEDGKPEKFYKITQEGLEAFELGKKWYQKIAPDKIDNF